VQKTGADFEFESWSTDKAIKEGFKSSSWVYAAINRLMKSVASVPWQTLTGLDGDEVEVMQDSAATALLRKPNPMMGGNQFFRLITSHLYLGGNAIIKKQRRTGRRRRGEPVSPIEALWPINPSRVKVEKDSKNENEVIYMVEGPNGRPIPVPAEEIIHIMFVDPQNALWGMSPLQAAARVVDTDVQAVKWNMNALQNRSVPDGVFTFDAPMNRDQWDEARQHVREEYAGSDNSRTPWVVGSGAKWQQMSLSPAEMDFLESRILSREEILSVFEVPPPLVGLYDNATLANIETARKIFWVDTVVPLLDVFSDVLTNQLGVEFGIDGMKSKIAYDVSNVDAFQDSLERRVGAAKELWGVGVPMEHLNSHFELGLEGYEGWGLSWVPTSVVPAEDVIGLADDLDGVDMVGVEEEEEEEEVEVEVEVEDEDEVEDE
jgi:HK97 family phage portal protein